MAFSRNGGGGRSVFNDQGNGSISIIVSPSGTPISVLSSLDFISPANILFNGSAISTTNVLEGTRLYFTDSRSRLAISGSGLIDYDNVTGVISLDTLDILDLISVSGGLLTYDNMTGIIGLTDSSIRGLFSGTGLISYNSGTGNFDLPTSGVTTLFNVVNAQGTALSYNGSGTFTLDPSMLALTTDQVTEGILNLYFTTTRARSSISGTNLITYTALTGVIDLTSATVTALFSATNTQGTGLSYSGGVYNLNPANMSLTTSQVTEGSNLYYTDTRARSSISGTNLITYTALTGVINLTSATVRAQLSGTNLITYSSSTGVIDLTSATIRALLSGTNLITYTSSTGVIDLTAATVRAQLSAGTGITYDSSTGIITSTGISLAALSATNTVGTALSYNSGTGVFNFNSANMGNTTITGTLNVTGIVTAPSASVFGTAANAESRLSITNTNAGSGALSILRIINDGANNFVAYLNSSTNSTDGGTNGATIRNNAGQLRLQGSGSNGMIIAATTGNVTFAANILLPTSTSSIGNVQINGVNFFHNGGVASSVFLGPTCGIYGATSSTNAIGIGESALTSLTSSTDTIGIGRVAGTHITTGDENIYIGVGAGQYNVTGSRNTGVGSYSLDGVSTNSNSNNTALGWGSLTVITTGNDNVAVGYNAGQANSTGINNVIIGSGAGFTQTTSTDNVLVGYNAGNAITLTGSGGTVAVGSGACQAQTNTGGVTAVGYQALLNNVTGGSNTAIGQLSMYGVASNSPSNNTAVGYKSLYGITTGSSIVAIGYQAGLAATTLTDAVLIGKSAGSSMTTSGAIGNVAIGSSALSSMVSNTSCVAIGYQALKVCTGECNTAVGDNAGAAVTTSSRNTFIGYLAGNQVTTGTNNISIGGHGLSTTQTRATFIGSFSQNGYLSQTSCYIDGIVGIGEPTPTNVVTIAASGQLGTGVVSSIVHKENVTDFEDEDTNGIMNIKGVTFNYIKDPKKTKLYGFILEDVIDKVETAVTYDNEGKPLGLDHTRFIPHIIHELQKLRKEHDQYVKETDMVLEEMLKRLNLLETNIAVSSTAIVEDHF